MSTGKTEFVGLNLWEPEDNFLRAEFNADNEKIDGAFLAVYETMDSPERPKLEVGSYVGTGQGGSEEKASSLTFAFAPKIVMIFGPNGELFSTPNSSAYTRFGSAVCYMPGVPTEFTKGAPWQFQYFNSGGTTYYNYGKRSEDGKTLYWYHTSGGTAQMNNSGTTYYYAAFY